VSCQDGGKNYFSTIAKRSSKKSAFNKPAEEENVGRPLSPTKKRRVEKREAGGSKGQRGKKGTLPCRGEYELQMGYWWKIEKEKKVN